MIIDGQKRSNNATQLRTQRNHIKYTLFIASDRIDHDDFRDLVEKRAESYDVDNVDRHYRGLLGEAAVAEAYGVDIDRGIYEHGDGGIDLTLEIEQKEMTVDVKTTSRKTPTFRVRGGDVRSCDVYLLCKSHPHGVEIIGWESTDDVISMGNLTKIDRDWAYEVEVDELSKPPMSAWKTVIAHADFTPKSSGSIN